MVKRRNPQSTIKVKSGLETHQAHGSGSKGNGAGDGSFAQEQKSFVIRGISGVGIKRDKGCIDIDSVPAESKGS
jgi:hypothetical protein